MDTDDKAGPSEGPKAAGAEGGEGPKTEAPAPPEPSTHTLENPARVVPAQVGGLYVCEDSLCVACV